MAAQACWANLVSSDVGHQNEFCCFVGYWNGTYYTVPGNIQYLVIQNQYTLACRTYIHPRPACFVAWRTPRSWPAPTRYANESVI